MPLYSLRKNSLSALKEKPFKLEKEIQSLTESNLEEIFGLKFIRSEFQLNGLRVDTLAFNSETASFVVIEYKRGSSFSVVDQGYAYLALLLNNKADFILEYNERMKDQLKKEHVDWSQSRVIFIAGSFTTYQRNAINFKDLPIELWEVKRYEDQLLSYHQINPLESSESIKTVSKSETVAQVNREVKKYTIEDHFKPGWDTSREWFDELRKQILELDERLSENPVRYYIGYRIAQHNVVSLAINKSKIKMTFSRTKPQDLKDPEKRCELWKNSFKHYNQHLTNFFIENEDDIPYAMMLIKQVLKRY